SNLYLSMDLFDIELYLFDIPKESVSLKESMLFFACFSLGELSVNVKILKNFSTIKATVTIWLIH
ncbi:MAG: hypothetical protein AB8B56_08620, partial [Crocinitomicaceae bacterium]